MGLLDDAIREHLELKRQHGADPDEVSRQEQEALGDPRRAEFARAGDEEPDEAAAAEPAAEDDAAEPPVADEPVVEPQEPVDAGDEREPFDVESLEAPAPTPTPEPEPDAVEPPPEPEASEAGYEEDPWLADDRDEVPAGESLDRPKPEEPGTGDDVLEETPDFLQETPEHDRLWFEQRPPRDFDWDK
jgi:hypothetical protein